MIPTWNSMYPYYKSLPMHPDGDFYSCGIRLSMCLHNANAFNKDGYKKRGYKVSANGWAMVAEELYQWLRRHELGEAQLIQVSGSGSSQLPGQNGIVYLRNCFVRTSDSKAATGDHIDLYLSGKGLLSAINWPHEFPEGAFDLMRSCRDGKVRYWPAS